MAKTGSIQDKIDVANPGDKIEIENGEYTEHLTINKPVHLVGQQDVTFIGDKEEPIITIDSDSVVLENINFNHDHVVEQTPAILIQGDYNYLDMINISTSSYGIKIDEGYQNEINNISIIGKEEMPISERNHGIDLWKADKNTIKNSSISFVEDGIYVESSAGNIFHNNHVTNSRYGYHLMFTKETELYENESYENISGMMIMGTEKTNAHHNIIKYNQKNVQSLGLLLFDVRDAHIEKNDIAHNRIGIFVESAEDNIVQGNNVSHNFIGLQFKQAEHNEIFHNSFVHNVVQGQAEESSYNDTNQNYWSDHQGLDLTGNNKSDITYQIDPFFLHLTSKYPPYRLLFQSPGMTFLEQLLHTPVEEQLIDQQPLMVDPLISNNQEVQNNFFIIVFSFFIFLVSLSIIYLGVRKT